MRRTLLAVLGFGALVWSPQAACTSDEGIDPAIAERMRAAVEGSWVYTDGALTIQFQVEQSSRDFDADNPRASLSFFGDAYACGNHGLVKPAGACLDVYHMPLDVEVTSGPTLDAPRGVLTSYGGSDGEIWFVLGTTELQGQLVGNTVTLQNGGTKSLRRVQP
jgi:hypothetical protein